jgi:iron(III) transport system substrate-binding protein
VLIDRARGARINYRFPASGTVVIDDAVALVRGTRQPAAAKAFIDFVGSDEAQLLAARRVYRLPARRDLPLDSVPDWVRDVEQSMVVAPMDWALQARDGAAWMRYWDQRVRGTGRR